jgi:cytidylate kinase
MKAFNLAMDGPAGAGKSTIAKKVAKKLNLLYIDTGAMYRALTWKALREGVPTHDAAAMTHLAANTTIELRVSDTDGPQEVWLDHQWDVSEEIRGSEVTSYVSDVARVAGVRERMVKLQRDMAKQRGVVMDGRDIGTHVLPDAEVKIFLTASVDERALRRYNEWKEKGYDVDFEELKTDIIRRDEIDSNREASPLRRAEDAEWVDTSGLSIDEVVEWILKIVRTKLGGVE